MEKVLRIQRVNGQVCITCGQAVDMVVENGRCMDCQHKQPDVQEYRYFYVQLCNKCKREVLSLVDDDLCLECAHKHLGFPRMTEAEYLRMVPRPRD